jgi:hypothetical protein
MPSELLIEFSWGKTILTLLAVAVLAGLDLAARAEHKNVHYLFACVIGTVLSLGLMQFTRLLLSAQGSPYTIAFGVLLILLAWRLLFGPWEIPVKATVLGAFVFWVALSILSREPPRELLAHLIAIVFAIIPAVVWSYLFLEYHREHRSLVILMFLAGMLSTAPILFYDMLVRHQAELNFFLFRIVPESFNRTTESFVTGQFAGLSQVHTSILTVFFSFIIVGLIEEFSKYWVLSRSGKQSFTSIDDVMQLAIIVGIGFAFAENSMNPGYFVGFVKQYLLGSQQDWVGFASNVLGRSILTSMVHIVSTGVLGYFLGLAIFAGPVLQEAETQGKRHRMVEYLSDLLRFPKKAIFRRQMLLTGLLAAILLHAMSNFLVTLPDILPGQPRTVGDLMKLAPGSVFHYVSLLLFPSLLYVVGGFWLLTELFVRKENMKERGHLITTDTFVTLRPEGEG